MKRIVVLSLLATGLICGRASANTVSLRMRAPAHVYTATATTVVPVYRAPIQPYYRSRAYATGGVVFMPMSWYVGFGLFGTRVLGQSGGYEYMHSGGGVDLYGGINISRALSLELNWLASFHNPCDCVDTYYGPEVNYLVLEGLTADAKIHLDREGRFDPYLQGGVGAYFLGREGFDPDAVGTGFQLGIGFDYYLSNIVTLGARARYHGIAMGPPESSYNDTFLSLATVEGSLGVHF